MRVVEPRARSGPSSGRVMDWLAVLLFAAGALCAATGLLPGADFDDTWRRIAPLVIFLGSVVVLAELTADAEVFDVVAARIAIAGRGRYVALFFLCVAFASASTMLLNLDTTAVLLTPVMLALAGRVGIAAMPLAMTTVWLANTASLILPVSNLTNLLAYAQVDMTPLQWAQRMWLPQLVSVAVTMVFLWVFFWRRGVRGVETYLPPLPHQPRDKTLFQAACLACALFVGGVLIDLPLYVVSPVCAVLLLAAYVVRRPVRLSAHLIPWRLLLMVPGLFLVVGTIGAHGLDGIMNVLIGDDAGAEGLYRAAVTGALMSNLVNNLPTYLAGEAAATSLGGHQLLGLLAGVNVGPLITPWASLATLIWFERCHSHGLSVSLRRFMLTGAVAAVAVLVTTAVALTVTS